MITFYAAACTGFTLAITAGSALASEETGRYEVESRWSGTRFA
jgi:hypothetical protein